MDDLITVGRYFDGMEAELARANLASHDIEAFVIEGPTRFNPLLAGAGGGVQLQVRGRDAARAEEILAQVMDEPEDDGDEDEAGGGEAVVRCPRCELEYCFFERVKARGNVPVPVVALIVAGAQAVSGKRWRCHKCEHVWDDPGEGPKAITRLPPGEPRPVFRLRRPRTGMGLFLGGMVGIFVAMAAPNGTGGIVFVAVVGLGWVVGRALKSDLCSEPSCRAPLGATDEECPKCKGRIGGVIERAAEHFARAADVRRELSAEHERALKKKAASKKKRLAAPAS